MKLDISLLEFFLSIKKNLNGFQYIKALNERWFNDVHQIPGIFWLSLNIPGTQDR